MDLNALSSNSNYNYNFTQIQNVLKNHQNYIAKGSNAVADPSAALIVNSTDPNYNPSIFDEKGNYRPQQPNTSYKAIDNMIDPVSKTNDFTAAGFRLDSYVYVDPLTGLYEKASFEQVNSERNAVVAAFAQKHGVTDYFVSQYTNEGAYIDMTGGVKQSNGITMLGGNTAFFTWEEMNSENRYMKDESGYAFWNHHIFGEIPLGDENGGFDYAKTMVMKKELQIKTADWYAVNEPPPNTYQSSYQTERYYKRGLSSPDFTSYNRPGISTNEAIDKFLAEYNLFMLQKEQLIPQIEQYYSADEILKRIKKAGITDESEAAKILKTQLEFGADTAYTIRTRGDANMDDIDTLEKSVANWINKNGIVSDMAEIFGESSHELAISVAEAALGKSDMIKLGESTVTYAEYLEIEKTMNQIYDNLNRVMYKTGSNGKIEKSAGNNSENISRIKSILNTNEALIQKMSGGYGGYGYNENIVNSIKEWNDKAVGNLIKAYDAFIKEGSDRMGLPFTSNNSLRYYLQTI